MVVLISVGPFCSTSVIFFVKKCAGKSHDNNNELNINTNIYRGINKFSERGASFLNC